MIKIKTTPNLYGVTLMGDYDDLDKLYDSISNYLSFYNDTHEEFPYNEYEYLLSLNYDIRHCYQGDRNFLSVDNSADRLGEWASPEFGLPEELRKKYKDLYEKHKNGNLYYSVEIIYPVIFHYMLSFEEILIEEPTDEWLDTETEFGSIWRERYSLIDAMRDRAALINLVGMLWENVQELFGREIAERTYDYFMESGYTGSASIYCDALIHCELVQFVKMNRQEKLMYLLACLYEQMDVYNLKEYPEEYKESAAEYKAAIDALNGRGEIRFPVRDDFYDNFEEVYDLDRPMRRNRFEEFLNETYGKDPDPFELEQFEW